MVELGLIDVAIIFTSILTLVVIGSVIYLKKTKLNRTISKSNEGSILNHYNVLMNINEDQQVVIKSVTQKAKMLQRKIAELEGYEEEEKEPEINIQSLLPLGKMLGIGEAQLQMILQSDDAKKFIKKNSSLITNVLPLLATLTKNRQNTSSQVSIPENQA